MSKKLSDKDLKDWNKFVKSKDKINPKDELNKPSISKNKSTFVIDLNDYSLDQAYQFVEKISWFEDLNFNYHIGVDGISLFMILKYLILKV